MAEVMQAPYSDARVVDSRARFTRPFEQADAKRNRPGLFLLWVVGADPDYITETSERRWYHSMALAVLMVAMFAFIGASTTLNFRYPEIVAWPMWVIGGIVWATAVFIIDRGITSYVERYPTVVRKLTSIIPRVMLAMLAAAVVSEALVIKLLDSEITQQLAIDDANHYTERMAAAADAEKPETDRIAAKVEQLTNDLNAAKAAENTAQLKVTCETAAGHPPGCEGIASTGVAGRGPLVRDVLEPQLQVAKDAEKKAQAAYDAYIVTPVPTTLDATVLAACDHAPGQQLPPVDQERCASTARIKKAASVNQDSLTGVVLNRIIAVFNIGKDGSVERYTTQIVHGVLFALFLFLDLIPLIMKFSRGPTAHDERVVAAQLDVVPRFDDPRLRRSMWRDKVIGESAMKAARKANELYFDGLFPGQAKAQLRAAFDGIGPRHTAEFPAGTGTGRPSAGTDAPRDNLDDGGRTYNEQARTLGVNTVLGRRYRLHRPIGSGVHYAIYVVRDLQAVGISDELVAKIARDSPDEFATRGLQKEVDAGTGQGHPNVMRALSPVLHDDRFDVHYRIMPFYPDGDLAGWIRARPDRTVGEWLAIGSAILDGLGYNHERAVTHWDLKPENVLIETTRDGTALPVIGDWGNGKVQFKFDRTTTPDLRGTLDYCAPEQLTIDRSHDRRCYASDLYSWAAVMFALATGESPHHVAAKRDGVDDSNKLSYMKYLCSGFAVPRLTGYIPDALGAMLQRCMSQQTEERPLPGSPPLTDAALREWQVVPLAQAELRKVHYQLSREQLAQPVRLMVRVDDDGHSRANTEPVPLGPR